MENSMEVPRKLKLELPYDPTVSLLDMYLEKTIFTPQPPRAELSCCASALASYRQVLFRKRTDLGVIAHGRL